MLLCGASLSLGGIPRVEAQTDLPVNEQYRLLEEIKSNPQAYRKALRAGEERSAICRYCHGAQGISVKEHIPNLAGQQPYYLLRQFENFTQGVRRDYVMQEMAGNLTLEERFNVTLYFAAQAPASPSTEAPAALVRQGQTIFSGLCQNCHGASGLGQETFPRLAGQKAQYVENALNMFAVRGGDRRNVMMAEIAKTLSPREIEAVAAFISSLE